ncbi:MAG TPA: helix-turn-helix transcriptional regulator [Drouetiella sp.]|jgi:transcriptional regulator with XRE-family HTH domain
MLKKQEPELLRAVGNTIANRRQFLALTQQQLAQAVGIHRTYLSDIEQGKRNISIGTLHEIAIRLETSSAAILRQADKELAVQKTNSFS